MAGEVLTPITQALNDGALTRRELKALMKRSNGPAFRRLAIWALAVATTTTLVWLTMGTWLVWPAMFVHGILLVHHFALQHECVHYTPFKTRWLNDVVGNACGFVIALPHQFFRYEHADHHTHTQLKGRDPELIPLPETFWGYLWYISAVPYWRAKVKEYYRHALGRVTEDEKIFLPKEAYKVVFWEVRIMLALYAAILIAMVAFQWWAPLWYWFIPVLLGEPVMRWVRLTEHVGRPNVRDMRENTRTNIISPPLAFLSWNMNYHAEHHYAASVPFHALPKLHDKLEGYVTTQPDGYIGAHRDILAQLRGDKPRADRPAEA